MKNDEHTRSFLHLIDHSHGGKRESIEDEKHLGLFDHLDFCSDRVFNTVMNKNHLIKVRHVNSCTDGLKCLSYLQKTPDHCRSYCHCQVECSFGDYCFNYHIASIS
jgi:hypothetical protein